jgi:microcystin-dependent protein
MATNPLDAAMKIAIDEAVSASASLRFGEVLAVNAEARTVDVTLAGTTVRNVPLMEGASPPVDGVAWLLHQGSLVVCIGPGTTSVGGGGATTSSTPIGVVTPFAGATAPTGWLMCDGNLLSTTAYAALFAVIGYTYGGSGSQFAVPDMRNRFPMGASTTKARGTTGGSATISSIVAHSHGLSGSITIASQGALAVSGTALSQQSGESTGQNHAHFLDTNSLGHGHATDSQDAAHGHGTSTTSENAHTHGGIINNAQLAAGMAAVASGTGANRVNANLTANTASGAGSAHSHTVTVQSANATHSHSTTSTTGWSLPATVSNGAHWHSLSASTAAHSHTATHSLAVDNTGSATVDVTNPYLAMNYIIKAA